ncbi:MAG: threonine/serine exporter family protein [Lachnospiraceae bacterium]|nr:threonine/serine exporter family protein [Lachnospiraceae bacterium]
MNYGLLADAAMLAGELMLQGGAETYRVEDTVQRILKTSGAEKTEVLVLSTALMITVDDPSISAISKTMRISERGTNLGDICTVNGLSRKYCAGEIALEEMYEELKLLKKEKEYSPFVLYVCTLITVIMFTLLLGATARDAVFAGISAIIMVLFRALFMKSGLNEFMYHMTALACATFFVSVLQTLLKENINLELVVAGTAMPLLPGVAITNAIRDTLQGDYISGAARVMEAFVRAVSCAVGIGVGLYLGHLVSGGVL